MKYAEALDHNAAVRRGSASKPTLSHVRIEEAENGGHVAETHFESGNGMYHEPETHVFAKPTGVKPQIPEGHVLHHIAKMMAIPHEIIGKTHGEQSQEPEKEADED